MNKIILVLFLISTSQIVFRANLITIEVIKKDGDTIEAKIGKNNFPIRLIGIDCFERNFRRVKRRHAKAAIG